MDNSLEEELNVFRALDLGDTDFYKQNKDKILFHFDFDNEDIISNQKMEELMGKSGGIRVTNQTRS